MNKIIRRFVISDNEPNINEYKYVRNVRKASWMNPYITLRDLSWATYKNEMKHTVGI